MFKAPLAALIPSPRTWSSRSLLQAGGSSLPTQRFSCDAHKKAAKLFTSDFPLVEHKVDPEYKVLISRLGWLSYRRFPRMTGIFDAKSIQLRNRMNSES